MTVSEKIKDVISRELAGVLLQDAVVPEDIDIKVYYRHSIVRVTLPGEKLTELIKEREIK